MIYWIIGLVYFLFGVSLFIALQVVHDWKLFDGMKLSIKVGLSVLILFFWPFILATAVMVFLLG